MIGKYYLKIGGYTVPRVSQQRVYQFTRQENRTESFAGTVTVDRSALKYRVTNNIALCNAYEMRQIVTAAANITATVEFYDGDQLVTANMVISLPEKPQPIYYFGDRTKGVYYKDVLLEMEEI